MNFAKRNKSVVDFLFILALFGAFAITALFVVLFGARIYKTTVSNMNTNYEKRPYQKKLNSIEERFLLLSLKFRKWGPFFAPRKLALTQRAFVKIPFNFYLTIRTPFHFITSVALTLISTPASLRNLTKFFTTPVLIYA